MRESRGCRKVGVEGDKVWFFWTFGFLISHVSFINLKMGENGRNCNGRGAEPNLEP